MDHSPLLQTIVGFRYSIVYNNILSDINLEECYLQCHVHVLSKHANSICSPPPPSLFLSLFLLLLFFLGRSWVLWGGGGASIPLPPSQSIEPWKSGRGVTVTFNLVCSLFFLLACSSISLSDGTQLMNDVMCDAPFNSIGIKDGIVCFEDTNVGSSALQYCINCGFRRISGMSVRTCLSNGTWSGSSPYCDCSYQSKY